MFPKSAVLGRKELYFSQAFELYVVYWWLNKQELCSPE